MQKTIVDSETWSCKGYYDFFAGNHPSPNGGLTVMMDVSRAISRAKKLGVSLFLYYLHCSLTAANKQENYRFRQEGGDIVLYDRIHAGFTVARDDHSFGFAFAPYVEDLAEFCELAKLDIERCKAATGLAPGYSGEDVCHYTVVLDLHFTSLEFTPSTRSDIPKFAFGHIKDAKMPHAMQYHHGFIDGYHIRQYVLLFQQLLDRE